FKFPYAVTELLKKLQGRWRVAAVLILSWTIVLSWVMWDEGADQGGGMRSQQAVSETLVMHTKQILAEADRLVWRLVGQASIQDHDHSWLDSVLGEAKLSSLISGIAIYDRDKRPRMPAGHLAVDLSFADPEASHPSPYVVPSEPPLPLVRTGSLNGRSDAYIVKSRVNLGYFHQMLHLV